ncbi:MAG: TolC family protein [Bacteroidota bacterium]
MKTKAVILLLLGGLIGTLQAQEILSISKAVNTAMEENSSLQILKQQKKQLELERKTATGLQNPELVYFKEGLNADEQMPFSEQRLAIVQSVEFPLAVYYQRKALSNAVDAKEYEIQSMEIQIKAEVKKEYVNVLYAKYMQDLQLRKAELIKQMVQAVEYRIEMGDATNMQLMNLEVQLSQAQNEMDQAEDMLHEARYKLFDHMNLPLDNQVYTINFSDTLSTNPQFIHQDSALNQMYSAPGIKSADQRIKAAEHRVKEAQMAWFPDLNFSYYKQDYGNGYHYNGFEVGISVPLWGAWDESKKAELRRARKTELEYHREDALSAVKSDIEQAWHGYETSSRSVKRFEQEIRTKTTDLLDKNLQAYRLGQISLLELLDAQRLYLNTEASYLKTLRNYYQQAIELEKYTSKSLVY